MLGCMVNLMIERGMHGCKSEMKAGMDALKYGKAKHDCMHRLPLSDLVPLALPVSLPLLLKLPLNHTRPRQVNVYMFFFFSMI